MDAKPICPVVMLAAPASRQGKTLITASLARLYQRQGYRVRVFKLGPDFLDPKILQQASVQTVENLDLWIMGEQYCRSQLDKARKQNDLVLVESVMGLFDHKPSNADFAKKFNIPIILLIDASSMGASFAAIAYGMTNFQSDLNFLGIIANRVGSKNHQQLIQKYLPDDCQLLASIPRDKRLQLPERHLGLYQAEEMDDIDSRLDAAADVLAECKLSLPLVINKRKVDTEQSSQEITQRIKHTITIAIAKDAAFSFIYPHNLHSLQALGCNIVFFSPLHDKALPACDAIWLPGGYPECFATELANNREIMQAITEHAANNKAIYAECGGMLYLFDTLVDKQGQHYPMCGLLKGKVIMEARFQGIGLQQLNLFDETIRGHSFHHARVETRLKPIQLSQHQQKAKQGEQFFANGSLYASFLHLWFASSEGITRKLLRIDEAENTWEGKKL